MSDAIITPKQIHAIADEIFGKDRVDCNEASHGFELTVHFPEFTITNSVGRSHQINDLFVRFKGHIIPSSRSDSYVDMTGARTTVSLIEWQNGYAHSHLAGGIASPFGSFCLGASAFKDIMLNLNGDPTEDNWTFTLLALHNYVIWESIEGRPYHSISSLAYQRGTLGQTARIVTDIELLNSLRPFMEHLPKEIWEFNPGLSLIPNHPALFDFLNHYFPIRKMQIGRGGITQQMLDDARAEVEGSIRSQNRVIFKGKTVPLKIWDPNVSDISVTETNHIEKPVVDAVSRLLTQNSINHSKKFHYAQLKAAGQQRLRALPTF